MDSFVNSVAYRPKGEMVGKVEVAAKLKAAMERIRMACPFRRPQPSAGLVLDLSKVARKANQARATVSVDAEAAIAVQYPRLPD